MEHGLLPSAAWKTVAKIFNTSTELLGRSGRKCRDPEWFTTTTNYGNPHRRELRSVRLLAPSERWQLQPRTYVHSSTSCFSIIMRWATFGFCLRTEASPPPPVLCAFSAQPRNPDVGSEHHACVKFCQESPLERLNRARYGAGTHPPDSPPCRLLPLGPAHRYSSPPALQSS